MLMEHLQLSNFRVTSEETAAEYVALRDRLFPLTPEGLRHYPKSTIKTLVGLDNIADGFLCPRAIDAVKMVLSKGPGTMRTIYEKYPHMSINTLNVTLSTMCLAGVIVRVRRGLYMLSEHNPLTQVFPPSQKKLSIKKPVDLVEAFFDENPEGTLLSIVAWGKNQGKFFGYDRPRYELRMQVACGVLKVEENGYEVWSRV